MMDVAVSWHAPRWIAGPEPDLTPTPWPPRLQRAFREPDQTRSTMKVLVVEDDARIAAAIRRGLEAEGFAVSVAVDGPEGLWMAAEGSYDVIVLDLMLPGRNGFQVCADLRARGDWTPILVLTAKDGELDEAEALDTGADDYLAKPFSYQVLVARLRALARRTSTRAVAPVEVGRPAARRCHPPSLAGRPPSWR